MPLRRSIWLCLAACWAPWLLLAAEAHPGRRRAHLSPTAAGTSSSPAGTVQSVFGDVPVRGAELGSGSAGCLLLALRQMLDGPQAPFVPSCEAPPDFRTRVFVTVYPEPQRGIAMSAVPASAGRTTSALGDNIADSVRLAAIDLMTGEALKPGSAIALDVATEAEGLPVESLDKCSFAVDGIALSNRLGKLHFVLPNEFAQTSGLCTLSLGGKATYHVGELQTRLRAQSLEDGALFRFRTRSFILLPSGSIFEQKHGSSFEDIEIAPKRLLEGVTMSADYLVRSMQEDGRWTYVYDAVHNQDLTDTKGAAYNQMRHAGAAYFVADAFARLPRERSYLDAVDKAVAWLWPQLIPMGDFAGQPMASMCVDKGQLSRQVGCTGIVLVALVEWARNKGGVTDEELERMRQLARYIAHQQYPDGHFRKNSDRVAEEGIAPMPEEIEYYNGEAMLGIMRFYSLDRNETWKAVAYKAALWTIEIRDAGKTEETAPNDHWLAYALLDLCRYYKDPRLVRHAMLIGKAVVHNGVSHSTGSAGTRLEALTSVLRLMRFADRALFTDADVDTMTETAKHLAAFVLRNQYGPGNSYFLPNPERALGGMRTNAAENSVRDDNNQHAGSGLLHLEQLLSDPDWEKDGAQRGA